LLYRTEGFAAELARDSVGAAKIGIDHPQQTHALALLLEFLIDAGVIAPKNPHAYDGHRNRIVR
jgi:hypothetical protein